MEDEKGAEVTIEVTALTFSHWSGKNLEATLTTGTYKKEFAAKQGMTRGAAGSLHTQVRRWLQDNATQLLKARTAQN